MLQAEIPDKPLLGLRLLVVEDEFLIADELAATLAAMGGEVVGPVGHCAQAMTLLECEQVDLALLDVDLTSEKVYPVAQRLDQLGVPYIFSTGYEASTIDPAFAHVPIWDKPYDVERKTGELLKRAGRSA